MCSSAVIGLGLLKGTGSIQWRVLGTIGFGWVTTPLIAALICFVSLFFLQNVFDQEVYKPVTYNLTEQVESKLETEGIPVENLKPIQGTAYESAVVFRDALRDLNNLTTAEENKVIRYAEIFRIEIDLDKVGKIDDGWLTPAQLTAVRRLSEREFEHKWRVADELAALTTDWEMLPDTKANKLRNKKVKAQLAMIYRTFAMDR